MKSFLKILPLLIFLILPSCNTENLDEFDNGLKQKVVLDKESCETAFGYNKDGCFLDDGFKRWGWYIGPLSDPFEGSVEIYAAAGKCDISKGFLAGILDISYIDGVLEVHFTAEDGYGFQETHLYVGNEKYPTLPNGKPTVAPGKYGNSHVLMGAAEDSYKIDDLTGDIYIIAHAVVCEIIEECEAEVGLLKPDPPSVCLVNGEATITATVVTPNVVPDGYEVLYVLTKFSSLFILAVNDIPQFTVSDTDEYRIHTLIYDPNTLDLSGVSFGTEVNELLIQGGGTICGALDVDGALFKVEDCDSPN